MYILPRFGEAGIGVGSGLDGDVDDDEEEEELNPTPPTQAPFKLHDTAALCKSLSCVFSFHHSAPNKLLVGDVITEPWMLTSEGLGFEPGLGMLLVRVAGQILTWEGQ